MEQRKTIRLKFVGFFPRFDPKYSLFCDFLKAHFVIQLVGPLHKNVGTSGVPPPVTGGRGPCPVRSMHRMKHF